jgi:DNA-binding response OmpR family regulator
MDVVASDGTRAAGSPAAPADRPALVVVEDDPHIAELVRLYLDDAGYRTFHAADGTSGLALVQARQPRLVVLDLGLPGDLDGMEVCRRIRATSAVPIVMLTARDSEIDRVLGLELGADDYLTKPFSPRELVARVRAVLRRTEGPGPDRPAVLSIGTLEVDRGRREARVEGRPVALAAREFALLQFLADHRGLALSRRQLLDGVWGQDWYGDDRTVDVHVRQLRKKLGDALPLDTVWGVGYRLD